MLTGKAYTMAGILMDAKTGLPVLTGEGAKKYTEDDLTKFTSGLMNCSASSRTPTPSRSRARTGATVPPL